MACLVSVSLFTTGGGGGAAFDEMVDVVLSATELSAVVEHLVNDWSPKVWPTSLISTTAGAFDCSMPSEHFSSLSSCDRRVILVVY